MMTTSTKEGLYRQAIAKLEKAQKLLEQARTAHEERVIKKAA